MTTVTKLTDRELTTVLAALRVFQEDPSPQMEHFNEHDPLDPDEIDALCESINENGLIRPESTRMAMRLSCDESLLARDHNIATLPPLAYASLQETGEVIKIQRGVRGYFVVSPGLGATERNRVLGVSPGQAQAMLIGSMFGFDVPGANPTSYDANGVMLPDADDKSGPDNLPTTKEN